MKQTQQLEEVKLLPQSIICCVFLAFACLQQVFDNCSCVPDDSPTNSSRSVRPGQCPQTKECSRSFTSYMAISVLSSFIDSLGVTPGYMVVIRLVKQKLSQID